MRRFLICLSCLLALPLQSAMLADDIRNHYLPEEYQTILVGDEDMPVFSGEPTTFLQILVIKDLPLITLAPSQLN